MQGLERRDGLRYRRLDSEAAMANGKVGTIGCSVVRRDAVAAGRERITRAQAAMIQRSHRAGVGNVPANDTAR